MAEWYTRQSKANLAAHIVKQEADLAAARVEIERLTFALAEVEALELQHGAVIARLAEENRRLREALRPFASEADMWGDLVPDDHAPLCVEMGHTDGRYYGSAAKYTVGDLRLARAALSSTGEKW